MLVSSGSLQHLAGLDLASQSTIVSLWPCRCCVMYVGQGLGCAGCGAQRGALAVAEAVSMLGWLAGIAKPCRPKGTLSCV